MITRFDPGAEFPTDERCAIVEMRNGPDDPAASIARARVAPGATTAWHHVTGTVERYVILEGTGRVEVGDAPPTDVGPLDVVTIPAGVRQRIANTGRGDLVFLCVCTPRFRRENYVPLE